MTTSTLQCFVNNGVLNAKQGAPCAVTIINNKDNHCVKVGGMILGYISFKDGEPCVQSTSASDQFDTEDSLFFVASQLS